MKPFFRPWPIVLAALVVAPDLTAQPPAGHVLLLDNQCVLEGAVEHIGDQYRVSRDGGETFIPANRVVAVCADVDAAYRHLRDKMDSRDTAAHLRLAHWCDANNLRTQAAMEAQTAAQLQPDSKEAQALAQRLRQKAAAPAPAPMPVPPLAAVAPSTVPEPIECSAEEFQRFTNKVQPVLMNTCAKCHSSDKAGRFHLTRIFRDGLNSPAAVQQNLAATLAQIDRAKPSASPLLARALAAHGGATIPPLRDRSVPAYQHLDEWVKMIAGDTMPVSQPVTPAIVIPASAQVKSDASAKPEFGVGTPPPLKEEIPDPFDPAVFNRQHYPDGHKPTPPATELPGTQKPPGTL